MTTDTVPETPAGTCNVMLDPLGSTITEVAFTPPKVTFVQFANPIPVIVTDVPAGPEVGDMPEIAGPLQLPPPPGGPRANAA